ncbi:NapC/NirT family cytochrome c [Caenimonas terrae]|uniref:Cytochrome c-type protein n=1 Tax=Caenimonas terrae TaxID=696074 RepID=A0ABW0NHE1_9BURK
MNALRRLWNVLARPSAKYSLLALLAVGFVAGVLFWGGFHTAMESTNTLEFCTGCHTMADNSFKEYKTTVHYANRSGVRAVCSDCHVPRDWAHKVMAKIGATSDVYHEILGSISTPEKFEARRMQMAQHQWDQMKASDSRECRNCHSFEAMSPDGQKKSNYDRHIKAKAQGKTCIDCHKGIAHQLPKGYKDPDE